MAHRFTNTSKWGDDWFIGLDKDQKLMFTYLCDTCDVAGFYELSTKRMAFDLSMTPDEVKKAFNGLKKAYFVSNDKRFIWLKNFLMHQKCLPLNPDNKMHVGIFNRFNLLGSKFDVDKLFDYLELSSKHLKLKGLKSPYGKGIGKGNNIEEIKGGAGGKILFDNFWDLYGKKIGDKEKVEATWNKLTIEVQTKILKILPTWKLQFEDKQFQPYPQTFLNQKRWNDEIMSPQQQTNGYPNFYNKKFESTLRDGEVQKYWLHLRQLGFKPKKDNQQTVIDWIKESA